MSSQLAALTDVTAAFDEAGIEHWVFGGWAVDFHLGHVSREHGDLDLAIWLDDMPRIEPLLASGGWGDLHDPDVDGGRAFGRDGVRLELTYLYRGDDGEVYTPLLDGTRGRWPAESLADEVGEIEGVRCRLISLRSLVWMKERSRNDKDRADYDVLRALPRLPDRAPRSSSR
jgi:hypothetical protein